MSLPVWAFRLPPEWIFSSSFFKTYIVKFIVFYNADTLDVNVCDWS